MSFADVIKKSVLEQLSVTNLSTGSIIISLGIATMLGLFIYAVYRFNSKSGFYQKDFNKSLAILPVITTAIILAMGVNLTISLGMEMTQLDEETTLQGLYSRADRQLYIAKNEGRNCVRCSGMRRRYSKIS